jgi:hypothetical protein
MKVGFTAPRQWCQIWQMPVVHHLVLYNALAHLPAGTIGAQKDVAVMPT